MRVYTIGTATATPVQHAFVHVRRHVALACRDNDCGYLLFAIYLSTELNNYLETTTTKVITLAY